MNAALSKRGDPRKALIAKIHAEKSRRGIHEDDYRAAIGRIAPGKRSSADLTLPQLTKLVEWVTGVGQAARVTRRQQERSPHQAKAVALWLTLWNLGAIRDPSEAALAKFVRRQVHVDAVDWWSAAEASPVIDALRAWCEREGLPLKPGVVRSTAARLTIRAQVQKIIGMDIPGMSGLVTAAMFEGDQDRALSLQISRLGEIIRQHKGDAA